MFVSTAQDQPIGLFEGSPRALMLGWLWQSPFLAAEGTARHHVDKNERVWKKGDAAAIVRLFFPPGLPRTPRKVTNEPSL
jgi:hypothetical protein